MVKYGKRNVVMLPAILVVVGLLASCTQGAEQDDGTTVTQQEPAGGTSVTQPSANDTYDGVVTQRLPGEWSSLDLQGAEPPGSDASQILFGTYDRLLATATDQSTFIPYLAESWEQTPTSFVFKIRSGATCADGTPVTPTVVANSFARLLDPDVGASSREEMFGPGPHHVSADDANGTVTITMDTPYSGALIGFTREDSGIVCPAGLAAVAADPTALERQTFGSGPYTIVSETPGDSITLELRPEWNWGPEHPRGPRAGLPETIIYRVVASETTAANLLLTGELDIASVTGPDVERLLASPDLKSYDEFSFVTEPLHFNHREGAITSDEVVRMAIMTALDQDEYNQAHMNGRGLVGPSIYTENMECYDPSTAELRPTPSIEGARDLLLSAGYEAGSDGTLAKDGQPLSLRMIGFTGQNSGPEYIQSRLNEVGFDVDLTVSDFSTWLEPYRAGDWDITVANFTVGPAPEWAFRNYAGPDSRGELIDAEIEEAYALATSTTGDERCSHWADVQRRFLEGALLVPLAAQRTDWFTNGFDVTPASGLLATSYTRRVEE